MKSITSSNPFPRWSPDGPQRSPKPITSCGRSPKPILSVSNKFRSCGSGPSRRAVRHHELFFLGQPGRAMRNLAKNDSAHWRRVARNGVRIIACPSPSALRNLIATHLGTSLGCLCGCSLACPLWRPGSSAQQINGSASLLSCASW